MDRRRFSGVLVAVLLISVAAGVFGAPSGGRLRALMEEGKKEQPKTQQGTSIPPPKNDSSNSVQNKSGSDLSPRASGTPLPSKSNTENPKAPPVLGPPLQPKTKPENSKAPPAPGTPLPPKSELENSKAPPVPGIPLQQAPASGSPPNPSPSKSVNNTQEAPKSGDGEETAKNKKGGGNSSGSGDSSGKSHKDENCGAPSMKFRCPDKGELLACHQQSKNEPEVSFLLLKNEGDSLLTVNIKAVAALKIDVKPFNLSKHSSKTIKVPADATDKLDIVVNAGNGDCVLQNKAFVPAGISQLFTYARMTPIYGAYVLFLTAVIAGGTWACCKFGRKRKRVDAGVPYQQLEIGMQPQSSSAVDTNPADGWDQGWDDDWDEEEAVVRPSERRPGGNVSTNGITSRSSNKVGWEDWDD